MNFAIEINYLSFRQLCLFYFIIKLNLLKSIRHSFFSSAEYSRNDEAVSIVVPDLDGEVKLCGNCINKATKRRNLLYCCLSYAVRFSILAGHLQQIILAKLNLNLNT